MSWVNSALVTQLPIPSMVSVAILKQRRGKSRVTFHFNKAFIHKHGIDDHARANVEIGTGDHHGAVRIVFGPKGSTVVTSGGGSGKPGRRIAVRIWDGINESAKRVRLDEYVWDAHFRSVAVVLPREFYVTPPLYQPSISAITRL